MRRIAQLVAGGGLLLLALQPAIALQLPDASVDPRQGPAGTEVTITVSQYSPNIEIFVYEGGDDTGTLLGTGTTGGDGTGSFPITIPVDAPEGSYLMYICGQCDAQFPEWATRGFTVTESPGTTTTSSTTSTSSSSTTQPTATATSTTATSTTGPPSTADSETSTTIGSASTTTLTGALQVVDDGPPRGLLIGLVVVLLVAVLIFLGYLISGRASRTPQPPPPPPPPAP